jgi:predicted Fe-S protein YdhL (DUF1289 family)
MRPAFSKTLLLLGLAAAVWTPALFGQKKNPAPREAPAAQPRGAKVPRVNAPGGAKGAAGSKEGPRRPAPNPITAVDRWNAMNPKQRERLLTKMPPERQKQFLDKVEKFNALPKEEQQLARERYARLSNLPPEQQQVVRRDIARLNNLPPARRQAISQEFLKLRKMSESERNAYLASPEFRDKFYPAEQQMIGNLTQVLSMRK